MDVFLNFAPMLDNKTDRLYLSRVCRSPLSVDASDYELE